MTNSNFNLIHGGGGAVVVVVVVVALKFLSSVKSYPLEIKLISFQKFLCLVEGYHESMLQ